MIFEPSANTEMNILVNGKPKTVPADTTAARLIEMLELGDKRVAVEVNQEIVPRTRYGTHRLRAGDHVEIVHAIGGG
jgi:sulfur carrier protein